MKKMNSLLTTAQVSKLLNCKPSSVYAWANTGKIPAFKVNGLLRFDQQEVDEWIKNSRVQPQPVTVSNGKTVKEKDIDKIVKRAIASSKSLSYNTFQKGKPDQIKSQNTERRK